MLPIVVASMGQDIQYFGLDNSQGFASRVCTFLPGLIGKQGMVGLEALRYRTKGALNCAPFLLFLDDREQA